MRARCVDRPESTTSRMRSRPRLLTAPGIEHPHQILEPLTFPLQHLPSERRQPVIPAARIVELTGGTLAGLGDEALLDQPFQRTVQRGRPQPHLSVAALQHVLLDGVAVLLAVDKAD